MLLAAGIVWVLAQATSSIEGIVVDSATGEPLAQVEVSIPAATPGAAPMKTETNADGRFTLAQLGATRHQLVAYKEGYAPRRIAARPAVKDLRIELQKAAVITGRLFDLNGSPIPQMNVSVVRWTYDDYGARALTALANPTGNQTYGRTNDRGEFRLFGLAAGEYYVRAATTFHPGTMDPARAASVKVEPGAEERLVDITLVPVKAVPIRIRVNNQTEEVPTLNLIELREGRKLIRNQAMPGAREVLELLTVPPGTYELSIALQVSGKFRYGRKQITVGDSPLDTEVVITNGSRVRGHAVIPQADGSVRPASGIRVLLDRGNAQRWSATSAADGTFVMEGVADGEYPLSVSGFGADQYVIESGEVEVVGDTSLEVLIGDSGGAIEGAVTDSKGAKIADAVVALVPDEPNRSAMHLYRSATSDENGAYSIRAIAPRTYRLFTWRELEAGPAFRNAEFMKAYEDDGTPVTVDANGRLTINVKVPE